MEEIHGLETYKAAAILSLPRKKLSKESRLVAQLREHQRDALVYIIQQYTNYVGTIIRNVLREQVSQEDLEELTADVFVALWRHAAEMRTDNLTSYLASIARSKAINYLRKHHPFTESLEEVTLADSTDISATAEQAELAQLLTEMLETLSTQNRDILIRYYYYHQTIREIAQEMGMKESTVKTRMHRSRKQLRQLFTERGYGYEQMEFI